MKNLVSIFAVLMLFSCGNQQDSKEEKKQEKLIVITVNYPLYYFAQRIGGDFIQLEYQIPSGVDPAYWVPDEKALEIYQSADIIFANGADYAKWMNNVSLPASRIVNTSFTKRKDYIQLKDVSTHSHGPEGKHEHTGYAFTTWLDFEIAAAQAKAIKDVLATKIPEKKDLFEQNFVSLNQELDALHENMIQVAMELGDQALIGSHPVYQYLSAVYGLQIHSVHFEPDELPSNDQWKELDHLLDHNPSKIMLWEDQPLAEIEKVLNEKGIKLIVFNPCGNKPANSDFKEIMNTNITSLHNAL